MKTLKERKAIAAYAITTITIGIKLKDKTGIMSAFNQVELDGFTWDELDTYFEEWNELVNQGNDILGH